MAVLNKMIYDVREALNAYSDDMEISNSYILYLYGIKRAKYLRQDLNNYQKTTDLSIIQTMCLGVESVTANQCGLDLECDNIMRTILPIPKPLELSLKQAITKIRPTNRIALPFNFVSKEKALFSQYSPFKNAIFSFLDSDRHIYFLSENDALNLLECVTVEGIFEDPLDLLQYSNCCNCEITIPCLDYDTIDYPLQPHYIDLIKNEIVNELVNKLKVPEDKINNATNE